MRTKKNKPWIKASEIKEFVFCPLSWWYKSKGYKYEDDFEELFEQGAEEHLNLRKQLDKAKKEEQETKIFLLVAVLMILGVLILFFFFL